MSHLLKKIVFFGVTFLSTAYVLLNSYEIVFGKDIPYANALLKLETQSPITALVDEFGTKIDTRDLNSIAKIEALDYLEFPNLGMRLLLEEGREINSLWYVRPSLGGYVGLNKNDLGYIIDYLLFTTSSWRTIPYAEEIEVGSDAYLYTDKGSQLSLVVEERHIISNDTPLVVRKNQARQIILIVDDPDHDRYFGYSLVDN